jgi:hypothetical protein
MAHGDTFSSPERPEDDEQFDRLRADLRSLPKLNAPDDLLARVRQGINTAHQQKVLPDAAQRPVFWDWMRGRMAFLSTIAGVAVVVVVAITLTRSPQLQQIMPIEPVPELKPAPAPAADPAPVHTPEMRRLQGALDTDTRVPADLREQSRSDHSAPASTVTEVPGQKSKESDRVMDEKQRSDAPAGNALPAPSRVNEKGDAAQKSESKDALASPKVPLTFEQEYDPIQKKELLKMRTGLSVRDSAAVSDSLKRLQTKPK